MGADEDAVGSGAISAGESVDGAVGACGDSNASLAFMFLSPKGGPRIEAVLLHQRPALAEACALLLHEQWGWLSVQARLVSLQRSSHAFPLSLVLLAACPAGGTTPQVLGHSKLSLVVGDGAGVLAESVLIAPAHRGQGLGRRLMEETERYARSRGKHRLFLSTPDKQRFYAHLGYAPCQPVTAARAVNRLVDVRFMEKLVHHSPDGHRWGPRETPPGSGAAAVADEEGGVLGEESPAPLPAPAPPLPAPPAPLIPLPPPPPVPLPATALLQAPPLLPAPPLPPPAPVSPLPACPPFVPPSLPLALTPQPLLAPPTGLPLHRLTPPPPPPLPSSISRAKFGRATFGYGTISISPSTACTRSGLAMPSWQRIAGQASPPSSSASAPLSFAPGQPQTLDSTPYRDAKGLPVVWMMKNI
ncbi:unnamed protein product [Lampetra fluviatilis]